MRDSDAKAPVVRLSKEKAQELSDFIVGELRLARKHLVAAAVKLEEFIRGEGWMVLGFVHMTDWLNSEIGSNDFYKLRGVIRLLGAGVPEAQVERMNPRNISSLVHRYPVGKPPAEAIKDAQNMPRETFRGKYFPNQKRIGYALTPGAAKVFDRAIERCRGMENIDTVSEAVRFIADFYLASTESESERQVRRNAEEIAV